MPVPQHKDDVEIPADASAARARQWYRAALALALIFASMPLTGRLFLGSWRFDGALDMAGLCLLAAAYLYLLGRDRHRQTPDSAAILDEALQLAATGATGRALVLLEEALRQDPGLWQAWEYRGRIYIGAPGGIESALHDFTEAIRLAPDEPHLYMFRSHVFALLGQDASALADAETAARLEGEDNGDCSR